MWREVQGDNNRDGGSGVGGENGPDSAMFFQFLLFELFPNISFTFHQNPRQ